MAEEESSPEPPAPPAPGERPREATWWTARAIIRCDIRDAKDGRLVDTGEPTLCDESIFLLRARSEEDAMARARELVRERECDYLNQDGETVAWTLVDILEVYDSMEGVLAEGTEVYSRLFDVNEGGTASLPPNSLRGPRRRGDAPPAEDRNDPT